MLHRPLLAGIDHFNFGEVLFLITVCIGKMQDRRVAGGFIAHASKGTVIFVANALPGQRVNARVLRRKSSFIDAETASARVSQ